MRVLVFDDNATERASIVSTLQDGSLRVEAVGDAAACLAAIEYEAPQVIVLAVPSFGGIETLRLVSGSCDHAYIVAVLEAGKMGLGVSAALSAGAHDFLRRPVVPEQLHARVHAPTRLIKWVQSVSNTAAFCAPYGFDVTRLDAWQNLGELVARDLSHVLGRSLAANDGWPEHFDDVRAATIPMSLAARQTEIRVSIAVDRDTAAWLGNALLGAADASEETLDDIVRELANTAGGALKRAALPHNHADDRHPDLALRHQTRGRGRTLLAFAVGRRQGMHRTRCRDSRPGEPSRARSKTLRGNGVGVRLAKSDRSPVGGGGFAPDARHRRPRRAGPR